MTLAPGTFQRNPVNTLATQALSDAGRNVSGRFKLFFTDPRAPIPTKVSAAPSELLKGSAEVGFQIYRGIYDLAGEEVHAAARLPFALKAGTDWQRELHGFGWLRDLQTGGSELQRAQARTLISDWVANRKHYPECADALDVTARRLIAWLRHSPFLLAGASAGFEGLFFRSLGRHVRFLARHMPFAPQNMARFEAAIALSCAGLCLDMGKGVRDQAFTALSREIDAQILADGGHVSREPAIVVSLLCELLPLAAVIEKANIEIPPALVSGIDRMMPMVRLITHGDGGLAAFNGVGQAMNSAVRAIQEFDQMAGKPAAHARYSGYARLSAGNSAAIIDCGLPPIPRFAANAHAGLLSFEFSEGVHRIVVNCGAPSEPNPRWAKLARTTPAHSTASLNDDSSSRIAGGSIINKLAGGPLHIGPRMAECELRSSDAGTAFDGRHDGFARAFGLIHERRLWLASDGEDLRGEDKFAGVDGFDDKTEDTSFAIRFHLHPSVKATISQDGSSIMLLLPDRSGWRFTTKGARLALDESIYLVDRPAPQRSLQIVLSGFAARDQVVNWAFKKITGRRKPSKPRQNAPELPL
jgi:uncharacterized heparinase superfamily protein